MRLVAALATTLFWLLAATASAQTQRTDLNLVIAMDCSWSVDDEEYRLQIAGVAAVFTDPEIVAAIRANPHGSIGVTITHWSTDGIQRTALPWTRVAGAGSALAVSRATARLKRLTRHGGTSIAGALRYGQLLLSEAPYEADRNVIDIIADGENNSGGSVEPARDAVVRRGTTINALGIVNIVTDLDTYLERRVIGGEGAFVERAGDYTDFQRAFRRKLLREIRGNAFAEVPVKRAALQD